MAHPHAGAHWSLVPHPLRIRTLAISALHLRWRLAHVLANAHGRWARRRRATPAAVQHWDGSGHAQGRGVRVVAHAALVRVPSAELAAQICGIVSA